jgi:hypothetical protein
MKNVREKAPIKDGELISSTFLTSEGKEIGALFPELIGIKFDSAFMKPIFKLPVYSPTKYYGAANIFDNRGIVCRNEWSKGKFHVLCLSAMTEGNTLCLPKNTTEFHDFVSSYPALKIFEFDTFKELADWLSKSC